MTSSFGETQGPRGATAEDLPFIGRLASTVFYSADVPPQTYGLDYPLIVQEQNLPNLRIFTAGSKPVSLVGIHVRRADIFGCQIVVGSIGGVCTYEEYRGRGLATALMLDAETRMREQGVDLVIVSGGRGLYRRLDYQDSGCIRYWNVPASPSDRAGLEIRTAVEEDAAEMARLYHLKPVRFIRPLDDLRVALPANLRKRRRDRRLAMVAIEGGRMRAYLTATVRTIGSEITAEVRTANELAGDPSLILALAARVAAEAGAPSLRLAVPGGHEPLALGCERAGLSLAQAASQPGTFKLLDPPGFLDKIRPLLAERVDLQYAHGLRLSTTPDGCEFAYESQTFSVKGQAGLLRLVFEPGFFRHDLPPGDLGECLAACFPLPLPWTGFSYV